MLTTQLSLSPVIKIIVLSLLILLPLPSAADPISDLLMIAEQIQGYQQQISGIQNTIAGLTNQIQAAVSGQSQWGRWQFTDYQSWGENTDQWQAILNIAFTL